tara:strand:+ start:426 stop:587 length:162 start_codon:yes stop_codon:yes gene_type:complete
MAEFKSQYDRKKLELCSTKFLVDVILRQERDIHNLNEEVKLTIREWKQSFKRI